MIEILALVISAILMVIALVHLYWAMGGYWPAKDEDGLARTVVGNSAGPKDQPYTMPARWLTLLIAILIFIAAFFPLMWAGFFVPYPLHPVIVMLGMWALASIFILRGVAGMLPFFDQFSPAEPFRSLNRKYYSPLCLLIGALFVALIYIATN